jgi:hypothetical protein
MNDEFEITYKEAVVTQFSYFFDICLAGQRKTTKNLSHYTYMRCTGGDSNRALSEYDSRELPLR